MADFSRRGSESFRDDPRIKTVCSTKEIEDSVIKIHGPSCRITAWTRGKTGTEYFLLENRQQSGFDAYLPADGLLIWHVDDTQHNNDHPGSYWVALVQADGRNDLEFGRNQGDANDPYPGGTNNQRFDATSNPSSVDHLGNPTTVAVTKIALKSGVATCRAAV